MTYAKVVGPSFRYVCPCHKHIS